MLKDRIELPLLQNTKVAIIWGGGVSENQSGLRWFALLLGQRCVNNQTSVTNHRQLKHIHHLNMLTYLIVRTLAKNWKLIESQRN